MSCHPMSLGEPPPWNIHFRLPVPVQKYICTSTLPHSSHVMICLGNRTHMPYYLVAIMLG